MARWSLFFLRPACQHPGWSAAGRAGERDSRAVAPRSNRQHCFAEVPRLARLARDDRLKN